MTFQLSHFEPEMGQSEFEVLRPQHAARPCNQREGTSEIPDETMEVWQS